MSKEKKRCKLCGHLLSKHPKPVHLVGFGEWDYYKHTCCVKGCQCPLSCFGQLLNEKGKPVSQLPSSTKEESK